jgi:membrane dipeptidase
MVPTVLGHWDVYELLHRVRSQERRPLAETMLPVLRAGGVRTVLFAVGGDSRSHASGSDLPLRGTLTTIDTTITAFDDTPGVHLIRTREDVRPDDDTSVGFLFVLEGGRPLEGSLAVLRQFHRLGVRCLLLTWNGRNELADGVGEGPDHGLSNFGRAVVREMRRLGMLLDLSHLSERGFYEAVDVHGGCVVATHSNVKALHDHPRNLSDDQIRTIAATGGVVGTAFMPAFLSPGRPSVETVVNHIEYVAELVGPQHAAIGPDFSYGPVAEEHRKQRSYEGVSVDLTVPYPIQHSGQLPLLVDALRERGFAAKDVEAIMGGNLYRVLDTVLPNEGGSVAPT